MSEIKPALPHDVPVKYIRENFEAMDRLAVVVLNKWSGSVVQRIATAESIAAADFQAWLRYCNERERCDVYISMNALHPTAKGRTKQDVAEIRHVYLDLDEDAEAAVKRLLHRQDLPKPNYLIDSSPGKWQVVWKVQGFAKEEAEGLQRGLAREAGADPAATDCSRVLRLPGYYNQKYARTHVIGVEGLSQEVYRAERFPKFPVDEQAMGVARAARRRETSGSPGKLTQSERDWAYAKRALARGEPTETVVAAIALHRRFDKHNPQAYAELTVRKAAQSLERERVDHAQPDR
jgi:hypothetical protein